MHPPLPFRSPLRPTMASGRPGYPYWQPVAALPAISITPTANGWRLHFLLALEPNVFTEFAKYVPLVSEGVYDDKDSVESILVAYSNDPEGCMRNQFRWPGLRAARPQPPIEPAAPVPRAARAQPRPAPARVEVDLPDLGL